MRIVNRATFLTFPDGTVFSDYDTESGCGDIEIKGDTLRPLLPTDAGDYYCQRICESLESNSSEDLWDKFRLMEQGTSCPMDFMQEGRDGCYEQDQMYAVWEPTDVLRLFERLLPNLFKSGALTPQSAASLLATALSDGAPAGAADVVVPVPLPASFEIEQLTAYTARLSPPDVTRHVAVINAGWTVGHVFGQVVYVNTRLYGARYFTLYQAFNDTSPI